MLHSLRNTLFAENCRYVDYSFLENGCIKAAKKKTPKKICKKAAKSPKKIKTAKTAKTAQTAFPPPWVGPLPPCFTTGSPPGGQWWTLPYIYFVILVPFSVLCPFDSLRTQNPNSNSNYKQKKRTRWAFATEESWSGPLQAAVGCTRTVAAASGKDLGGWW